MSNAKKRSKKYTSTLQRYNTDTVAKGNLYFINNHGGFSLQNKLKVKIDGITIETYLKLYKELQETHRNTNTYIDTSNKALTAFLIKRGYNTPSVNLNALIEDLEELLVVIKDNAYDVLQTNAGNYIIAKDEVNGHIVDRQEYPDDLLNGYYKIVDNKLVLDEEMKLKLSGVLF